MTFRIQGEVHEDKFHNQDVRVFTMEIPPMCWSGSGRVRYI
jgi:hypothetical protein